GPDRGAALDRLPRGSLDRGEILRMDPLAPPRHVRERLVHRVAEHRALPGRPGDRAGVEVPFPDGLESDARDDRFARPGTGQRGSRYGHDPTMPVARG